MAAPTREEFDKGLALNEERMAHVETRIAQAMADVRSDIKDSNVRIEQRFEIINVKLEHVPTTWVLASAIAGSTVAVVTLIVAFLAFGGSSFNSGITASSVSVQQAQDAKNIAEQTSKRMDELAKQNDVILSILKAKPSSP